MASLKGEKGDKGFEGILGFQGVKVSSYSLVFCFFLKSGNCDLIPAYFYFQGAKGITGATGRAGPRGKQVGWRGIPCSTVDDK